MPVGCRTGPERNSTLDSIILQPDSYARSTTSSLKISSRAPQERRPAALRHRSHLSGQHSTAQLSLLKAESAAEVRRGVFKRTPLATTKGLASCKLLPPAANTLSPSLRLRLASPPGSSSYLLLQYLSSIISLPALSKTSEAYPDNKLLKSPQPTTANQHLVVLHNISRQSPSALRSRPRACNLHLLPG